MVSKFTPQFFTYTIGKIQVFSIGDIATDLAAIWMMFADRDARDRMIAEYGNISEATLKRAKGWAIVFGVILLDTGLIDNPRHTNMGETILNRLLEDRK
ncbi:hypothetical protein [Brunnivagina elsteri]|uniref:Uncharacterized protein n=1 Tax=Brunnivagina elsteri CCALA 953 TaxID=987040 RepID=A0A2A2TG13_9CYAN|nr:hypothetical protein [Calothrix elsteri]PAX52578.1 hypothetical protein CK510_18595 [Calothrix elsteri CCALA 953]